MVEWTDEAREAVRHALVSWEWENGSHLPVLPPRFFAYAVEKVLKEVAPHVELMVREARAEGVRYGRERTSQGRCRTCGAAGGDHSMHCRLYAGPLTHEMRVTGWNETFGGTEWQCSCGQYVRLGGMAGREDDGQPPRCPDADRTAREAKP